MESQKNRYENAVAEEMLEYLIVLCKNTDRIATALETLASAKTGETQTANGRSLPNIDYK